MEFSSKEFDVIVVGSGPGGATVARELSRKGKSVLILEWGDNDPVNGTLWNTIPRMFIPFKSLFITGQALGMVRGITTGGSSQAYSATAFEPPVDMLNAYGVDIRDEVEEIRNVVPIDQLSDELMSPAGQVFYDSAKELGYDVNRLNKFIYQEKCEPGCVKCSYGCPKGAKWFAANFVDDALNEGGIMVNKAKVNKVIVKNKKAVGVEFKHKKELYRAYAPQIVIAAGGIGSPLILRESGIKSVGYEFFFDPLMYTLGKVKDVKSGKGVPMSAGIHFPEDGIVLTDFNLPRPMKLAFDLEVFKLKQAFSHSNVVPIMIKVKDGLGGSIKNGSLIWKTLKSEDKKKLDKGHLHAKKILENAGATDIYRSWIIAAHPGGTVKIGEHVNSDLETQIENLYVCDCSVIPEAWGLPPTFTLLALGKRLGKHLLGETKLSGTKVKEAVVV